MVEAFEVEGRKLARNIGIDLAGLHTMAPGAGDCTPFLVIQALSKKSISGLTSISRLEKARWKIGTSSQPRMAVHHSADFPRSHVIAVEARVGLRMLLATSGMSAS
ncbi:MAG: hypothetical protein JO031_18955 [Ktedonobacteraceae bacterium]|nr:hypothetical protein [Ktedonobacteraceae bacterium]